MKYRIKLFVSLLNVVALSSCGSSKGEPPKDNTDYSIAVIKYRLGSGEYIPLTFENSVQDHTYDNYCDFHYTFIVSNIKSGDTFRMTVNDENYPLKLGKTENNNLTFYSGNDVPQFINEKANQKVVAYKIKDYKEIFVFANLENVPQYTISFNSNGGSGTMSPVVKDQNSYYYLPSNSFTPPEGYRFIGWKIDNTGEILSVNYRLRVTGNVTLYAQWEEKPVVADPVLSYKIGNNDSVIVNESQYTLINNNYVFDIASNTAEDEFKVYLDNTELTLTPVEDETNNVYLDNAQVKFIDSSSSSTVTLTEKSENAYEILVTTPGGGNHHHGGGGGETPPDDDPPGGGGGGGGGGGEEGPWPPEIVIGDPPPTPPSGPKVPEDTGKKRVQDIKKYQMEHTEVPRCRIDTYEYDSQVSKYYHSVSEYDINTWYAHTYEANLYNRDVIEEYYTYIDEGVAYITQSSEIVYPNAPHSRYWPYDMNDYGWIYSQSNFETHAIGLWVGTKALAEAYIDLDSTEPDPSASITYQEVNYYSSGDGNLTMTFKIVGSDGGISTTMEGALAYDNNRPLYQMSKISMMGMVYSDYILTFNYTFKEKRPDLSSYNDEINHPSDY